jgi:hypothetical protein
MVNTTKHGERVGTYNDAPVMLTTGEQRRHDKCGRNVPNDGTQLLRCIEVSYGIDIS